jgi:hypothetical protein
LTTGVASGEAIDGSPGWDLGIMTLPRHEGQISVNRNWLYVTVIGLPQ